MDIIEQTDNLGCKYHQIIFNDEHIASYFSEKIFLIRPCSVMEILAITEAVTQFEKTKKIVGVLLERQKEITSTNNPICEGMEKIEPFSWMHDDVKQVLSNSLSPEQMRKLDECGRANLVGQRMMTRALKNALHRD